MVDNPDNLPVVHPIEKADGAARRLEILLRSLDGPMRSSALGEPTTECDHSHTSVSNALVPYEANDIGDVDERPNPRACHLGYPEGYECAVEREAGRVVMSDPPNWALAGDTYMHADKADFIEDLTEWA